LSEPYNVFVGIDWGQESHQVSVSDKKGDLLGERSVPHRGDALGELSDWLLTFADGDVSSIAVALEVPRGPIVDTLLERGYHVFAINPKQLDRFRDRYSVAGAKDDRRDARVLGSAVRTDPKAFRALTIDDPLTIQLREYSRHDVELGEDFQRAANRLRDLLVRTWPEVLKLSSAADEPWLWGLLALSASPDEMRTIRPARIRQLLREYRIRRLTVEDVLAVVRSPTVRLAPGVREGVRVRINDLIAQLQILHAQRRQAERLLATTLEAMTARPTDIHREHHDAAILQSLPGVGIRIAATMLAEAAQPLRDRDYHALRTLGGCAPVTKRSGKSHMVCMRTACQRRLRSAFHWWAERSVREEDRSRAHYRRLRQRGHNHARALRSVSDRLLAMLIAMLKAGTLYDADRRALVAPPA